MFKAIGRLFTRIKEGLAKTRSAVGGALRRLIGGGRAIDKAFLDSLEETRKDLLLDPVDRGFEPFALAAALFAARVLAGGEAVHRALLG